MDLRRERFSQRRDEPVNPISHYNAHFFSMRLNGDVEERTLKLSDIRLWSDFPIGSKMAYA